MSTLTTKGHCATTDAIMRIMENAFDPAFGEAWNRRQVSDALALPSTDVLLVNGKGAFIDANYLEAAGFLLSRHTADEEELLLIAVLPEYRGRGLGQTLLDRLFAAGSARGISRVFLEMRRGNPAVHLYHKVGFEPVGERPAYYKALNGDRIDAITFACSL